jgi:cell division protein FtsW (lipid II flippase)
MGSSVYQINKSINKPVEFKGLKAQYIWYLGGGLVGLFIFFAIIYITGINIFICLALIVSLTTALFMYVYKLSHRYGEHGLMKKLAKKRVPKWLKPIQSFV